MKAYRLFSAQEACEIVESIADKQWTVGKANNANKQNDEITDDPHLAQIGKRVIDSPIVKLHFVEAMTPPKLSRYRDGGEYSSHADGAQQNGIRSDLACTLFLSDDYEGGELCVMGHEVKLKPGEVMVYECWRPHQVKPVTKGERIAAVWWMQSYIRSEEQRDLLGMLRAVIGETTDQSHFAKLGAIHEKLTKMWWC